MSLETWPVPFIISPQNFEIDAAVSFGVSILLAIMINAEAQAFVSTFLGDSRIDAKDRFHFNAFLHLDIWGTICYLVGGFGWPRIMDIDTSKFKHPRVYLVVTRFAGSLANLFLASIGGSLVMFMNIFSWNPRVFLMVIGVNITTAIYNLIPIPPLAGGVLLAELIPDGFDRVKWWFYQVGPYLLVGLVLLARIKGEMLLGTYFNPLINAIFNYIK
jgi:Zn-dependent protease